MHRFGSRRGNKFGNPCVSDVLTNARVFTICCAVHAVSCHECAIKLDVSAIIAGLKSPLGRLRVALVGEYPVTEESIQEGGVQSVTYALAHALARKPDIECHVIAAMKGATTKYRRVGELHVHHIGRLNIRHLVSVTLRIFDLPALVRLIRSINPDVVHAECQDCHALAALRSGFPTVITPHGVVFIETRMMPRHWLDFAGYIRLRQYLVNDMESEVFRRARDMIIISRYLPQIYGTMLQARKHFIENPIGQEFFQVPRSPEPGRLLFVGTVVPRKRVQDIVAAVAQVLNMPASSNAQWKRDLQLRIAGPLLDAGSEALLRSTIESTGLQRRVILLGPVSQSQLVDEYARAQILVLASKEETAPQVIAQAMACGLPTVASAVGGIPAMIREGETGLLFPFSDTQAFAKQLFRLLNDYQLREAIETRIVREGRERFHPDSVAAQTVAVYREILSRKNNGLT
jgi:glycosyltransferase involved in cell wall biosynthesis